MICEYEPCEEEQAGTPTKLCEKHEELTNFMIASLSHIKIGEYSVIQLLSLVAQGQQQLQLLEQQRQGKTVLITPNGKHGR